MLTPGSRDFLNLHDPRLQGRRLTWFPLTGHLVNTARPNFISPAPPGLVFPANRHGGVFGRAASAATSAQRIAGLSPAAMGVSGTGAFTLFWEALLRPNSGVSTALFDVGAAANGQKLLAYRPGGSATFVFSHWGGGFDVNLQFTSSTSFTDLVHCRFVYSAKAAGNVSFMVRSAQPDGTIYRNSTTGTPSYNISTGTDLALWFVDFGNNQDGFSGLANFGAVGGYAWSQAECEAYLNDPEPLWTEPWPVIIGKGNSSAAPSATASGGGIVGGPSVVGAATAAPPAIVASGGGVVAGPSVAGATAASPPAIVAAGGGVVAGPTVSGAATASPPAIAAAGGGVVATPSIVAAAAAAPPSIVASGGGVVAGPLVVGAATATPPGAAVASGGGIVAAPSITGGATAAPPAIVASGGGTVAGPTVTGAAIVLPTTAPQAAPSPLRTARVAAPSRVAEVPAPSRVAVVPAPSRIATAEENDMSEILAWPAKDPFDEVDYSFDWAKQLSHSMTPDSIASVTWIVPAGLTQVNTSRLGGLTTIWLAGGVADSEYLVSCRIVTAQGRKFERNRRLPVQDL